MLYVIGTGLNGADSLTNEAMNAIRVSEHIFLESYTSLLNCSLDEFEKVIGKRIILADRDVVENQSDFILEKALVSDVAFLVIGDPLSATTHIDLILRAKEKQIKIKIMHNSSVLTAIGETGLSLYKFGKVSSIPYVKGDWVVETPYDVLKSNGEMHTLFLLDLRPAENKFMTTTEAIEFLLNLEKRRRAKIFMEETLCVVCGALGTDNQEIKVGTVKELLNYKLKVFPQCLIVPGKMHFMEEEYLQLFR